MIESTGVWRKSSHSATESACVELSWRKASFSGTESDCVELAWADTSLLVRDSKHPEGPTLELPTPTLISFAQRAR
ncbi:hypothetical protein UO65_3979 [Actinokineospora spheciospongiae]|uniref:DUF397 domain-containing protein n=1 Tax=Actinokineospora spheciospongiae TaxID=909613 RepID=W7IW69_9PSEU|nr:DUF397 domain-containing protein [Actinokineospora spheciospongiae]EWC60696.1 hypothetical protein UO65_3979 [Actinokineospora spheciospongiae]